MTPFEKFLQALTTSWQFDLRILAKLGALLLLFLFILFALVVMRQVGLMSRTVSTQLDGPLMWAGRALVILAGAAFIVGVVIL